MDIKYDLVLHAKNLESEYDIEYNNIGAFQTRDSNTPGYYIVRWTFNYYTLQGKYTCHSFDLPVITLGGEPVFPANFMTPIIKLPNGITIQLNQYLSW